MKLELGGNTKSLHLKYWSFVYCVMLNILVVTKATNFTILAPGNSSDLKTANFRAQWPERFQNLSRLSLRERCRNGLPLSIAAFAYPPYVKAVKVAETSTGLHKYTLSGMIPALLGDLLRSCCHPNTSVEFGLILPTLRAAEDILREPNFDFVFPVYGHDTISDLFRGHVFIRLYQAPSVVLLVHDSGNADAGRTNALFKTLGRAWPMLVFILLLALLASMILWFLEHTSNSKEFPPSFFEGTWEGFWWALVTMTTVGYGDRTPKSRIGRMFAMLWILTGVTSISIFTALVTSSLWASTSSNFRLHGSVIGALDGSEEYRLAVNLNAEVKGFTSVQLMLDELSNHLIDGAMIDNYVITSYLDMLGKGQLRTEETIYHSITYGMALSPDNDGLQYCANWMLYNYPDTRNQITAANLKPLKNPADEVSAQFRAAEGLFFREKLFELITYCGMAVVGLLVFSGVIWEFCWRRPQLAKHLDTPMTLDTRAHHSKAGDEITLLDSGMHARKQELRKMVAKYRAYHEEWIKAVQELCDERTNRNEAAGENNLY